MLSSFLYHLVPQRLCAIFSVLLVCIAHYIYGSPQHLKATGLLFKAFA